MHLERLFTHRLIRLLRVVLPLLVVGLALIPAWNYYARRVQKEDSPRFSPHLPSGVSVRTEGFTHSRTEGGRTQFTVNAKQSLGFKDEKYILQDVDVTIYGASDGEPPRRMRGENCTYDQASNDVECTGRVEVELEPQTMVRTEKVIYNHNSGDVMAPGTAIFEKNGTTGRANSFEYGMKSGLLKLIGDVKIQTPNALDVETAVALLHQKENWTRLSGGVFIKSPNGWIRGTEGRATLAPETYQPKVITVEGNVTAESQSRQSRETWKMRAAWIEATISEAGQAELIRARTGVEIEKISGDVPQRLTGGEVDTILRAGAVMEVEARHDARMAFGPDQTLQAPRIWTNTTGSVKTSEDSILTAGDSTIEGKEFEIENQDDFVSFRTSHPATLKKTGGIESSSDQTRARFERRTSMLMELFQSGNFRFRTPQYEGRAQTGRFEEGGTVVTLDGSPVVSDAAKRLEASQIRIHQKDNTFLATGNVSTLLKNPEEPVLVKAERGEGGADSILYTGNVQLWRGAAYIQAERLNAIGQGGQKTRVHAEGRPGVQIQSNLQNIRATSDTLDYDDTLGTVRYLGRVRAQKQDMILETADMTVQFRDDTLAEIVAIGNVVVSRTDQRGTGERAVYNAATDVVTLMGKNAQVSDKEHGLVQAPMLTMANRGRTASAAAGKGERTITKYRIQNSKK
jgi:LPS export ABC transporter protein LptC